MVVMKSKLVKLKLKLKCGEVEEILKRRTSPKTERTHPVSVKSGTGVKIGRDVMSIYTSLQECKQFR